MIFDSHAHLISSDRERYPPASPSGRLDEQIFNDPITVEHLIAEMDAHGVRRALAVQRGQVYGFDNSYVCDAAKAYPERLAALCSVDGLKENCGDQVRYWVGERGAVGIRLMKPSRSADPSWLAGESARSLWAAAAELDIPVSILRFGENSQQEQSALEQVLKAFPSVQIVLDHLANMAWLAGPPDYGMDALLLKMAKFPRVSTKFTTVPLGELDRLGIDAAPIIRRLVDVLGAERGMWGSDIGQSQGGYEHMVALGRAATRLLNDQEREIALCGAAARVYGRSFQGAA